MLKNPEDALQTPTVGKAGLESKGAEGDTLNIPTPTIEKKDLKAADKPNLVDLNKARRGLQSSMNAPGLQTFNNQYMPFASGFEHQIDEMVAYRSSRKTTVNPTAAVSDDVSYYYELDNGRVTPATVAADPTTYEEFVRNTSTASYGGFWRKMLRPID
mmetsp:Transcript_7643/g.15350  ORF Transcript_7643/g.15350 Transcript_7643/m.15350 type:complete len:158 (+) Transcript_7643:87-560(+)